MCWGWNSSAGRIDPHSSRPLRIVKIERYRVCWAGCNSPIDQLTRLTVDHRHPARPQLSARPERTAARTTLAHCEVPTPRIRLGDLRASLALAKLSMLLAVILTAITFSQPALELSSPDNHCIALAVNSLHHARSPPILPIGSTRRTQQSSEIE